MVQYEALQAAVGAAVGLLPDRVRLAKHVRDKFKWRALSNQPPPKKKGGAKGKICASDVRELPCAVSAALGCGGFRGANFICAWVFAQLKDGDLLAVKDALLDPKVRGSGLLLTFLFYDMFLY